MVKGVSDMMRMLLAAAGSIAAIALSAGTAQAQQWSASSHRLGDRFASPQQSPCSGAFRNGGHGHDGDHHFRDGRNSGCGNVYMDWYGGEWAEYNNRSWEPTSYNDWWHEEPWRAYPAWMRRNQDCTRQWYAGDTLRC
jgi:hypothetical protein